MNLFSSFAANNSLWLLWYRVVLGSPEVLEQSEGLCVASLFCFFNGEVMAQVKRKWRTLFFRPRANSYTATQVSVSEVV
uniref:Uncharacterized protein n=1 Tax=Phlebotomus papatasi TaxID=29031 RepID=A0A1B0D880_PHLPP